VWGGNWSGRQEKESDERERQRRVGAIWRVDCFVSGQLAYILFHVNAILNCSS
jgi:hypothetical protein